jgi:site-specific recombinase XerD
LVTSVKRRDIVAWQNHLKGPQILYKGVQCRRHPFEGQLSPHTIHKRLRTARIFWIWLEDEGEIEQSPMRRLKLKKPPKPNVRLRTVPIEKIQSLVAVMRQDPRDWAIFCVLIDTGVRAIGLSNMELQNLNLDHRVVFTLEKGDKPHFAMFEQVTARALKRYLKVRPKTRRREVFFNEKGGKLNDSTVRGWLYRRCDKAGIERIGPHTLRRSLGCHLAMKRVPISLIQKHLGHSTAEITAQNYMPDGDEDLHDMLSKFGLLGEVLEDFEFDDEDEDGSDEDDGGEEGVSEAA